MEPRDPKKSVCLIFTGVFIPKNAYIGDTGTVLHIRDDERINIVLNFLVEDGFKTKIWTSSDFGSGSVLCLKVSV